MIVIYAMGGIGNQLFQYALYEYFSENRKDVFMDRYHYDSGKDPREFLLDDLTMDIRYIGRKERKKFFMDYDNESEIYRYLKKYIGKKLFFYSEKDSACFDKKVLRRKNAYLYGYWQSEKYFYPVRDKVIEKIRFPEVCADYRPLKDEIVSTNSVSVHIRRGDYLKRPEAYGNLFDSGYYEQAMRYIEERVSSPVFFIFSDDIEWCRHKFSDRKDVRFVAGESEKSYDDIHLMSLCQHNIIANSSFSWWGAYLNKNQDKITITPKWWLVGKDTPDIWCDGWIRL